MVCVSCIHSRGREEDKERAKKLRDLIILPKTKLPKSEQLSIGSSLVPGIMTDVISVSTRDGATIDLYICTSSNENSTVDTPTSIAKENPKQTHQLIFFCHGGGWIMANRWSNEPILCEYALKTNSIVVYIHYRLAPEYQHPTAVYDCYDCLLV